MAFSILLSSIIIIIIINTITITTQTIWGCVHVYVRVSVESEQEELDVEMPVGKTLISRLTRSHISPAETTAGILIVHLSRSSSSAVVPLQVLVVCSVAFHCVVIQPCSGESIRNVISFTHALIHSFNSWIAYLFIYSFNQFWLIS